MKTRSSIFKEIMDGEGITLTDVAKRIGVNRNQIYRWLAQSSNTKNPITTQLMSIFPTYFQDGDKESFKAVNLDLKKAIEQDNPFAIPEPKFSNAISVDYIKPANEDSGQLELPVDLGEKDVPEKKKIVVMKNLKCVNKCYFMKVPTNDYNRAKPSCPICGCAMLTKEDRKSEK